MVDEEAEDIDNIDVEQEEQELFEHHRIVVEKGQELLRIDKFLVNRLPHTSRNRIQIAADAECILVNGKPVKSNYKVKGNDVISVVMAHPVRDIELIAQNIPLDIVYEDDDVIVVNKQVGLVVHPAFGNYSGTLVNALMFHLGSHPDAKLPENKEFPIRPGLVHRIDKNTSGLLLISKNERAMTFLAKQFFDRKVKRTYNAIVWGDFADNEGTITGNIGRNVKNRKVMHVFLDGEMGKHAVTHYKVIERFRYVSLVECKLETGRTHQIRVHMKFIGHPIFNDSEYGGDRILKGTTFTKYKQFVENCFKICPTHALHARTLGFIHPTTKKEMLFEAEPPEHFRALLEKWRNYKVTITPEGEETET